MHDVHNSVKSVEAQQPQIVNLERLKHVCIVDTNT